MRLLHNSLFWFQNMAIDIKKASDKNKIRDSLRCKILHHDESLTLHIALIIFSYSLFI